MGLHKAKSLFLECTFFVIFVVSIDIYIFFYVYVERMFVIGKGNFLVQDLVFHDFFFVSVNSCSVFISKIS